MGVQIQEIQIDGLKSHLSDKQINWTGKNMPHLRSVDTAHYFF